MRKLISSGSLGKNVFSYNVTDLTKKYDKVVCKDWIFKECTIAANDSYFKLGRILTYGILNFHN